VKEAKRLARDRARLARADLSDEVRASASRLICEHAFSVPELAAARTVAAYATLGTEVDTSWLLRKLLVSGRRVALPIVTDEPHRPLAFVRLQHPWGLEPGPHRVPAPPHPWETIRLADLDAFIVPGVAFGHDGARLGQGGGHYDRTLDAHPAAPRIGLAFEAQWVDDLPAEAHDHAMDVIVTEKGPFRPPPHRP